MLKHLLQRHRNAKNFLIHCAASGCGASFRKYDSFKKHCKRTHFHELPIIDNDRDVNDLSSESDVDDNEEDKRREAAYVIKLKAGHKLGRSALEEILQSTNRLLQDKLNVIKQKVKVELERDHPDIDKCFQNTQLFEHVSTEYKQRKYFKNTFGYVEPIPVRLGERLVNTRSRTGHYKLSQKVSKGYIVPFLDQLRAFLSLPEIQDVLNHENATHETLLLDIADGEYCQESEFLQQHPNALLFDLYTDDFEIVNPIGSHRKKHKLTAFYWTLLNVPPAYRSKLSYIQLAAIAKTQHLKKFGTEELLKDLVKSLKSLYSGIVFEIPGYGKQKYFGILCIVVADTLAAQLLGGFKCVGQANSPCRSCDVKHRDLKKHVFSCEHLQRDKTEHQDRVNILSELSGPARKYWSKEWGITGGSALLSVPHFDVTKCLLHDPMHILLEGIIRKELRCLLRYIILEKKFITLEALNQIISRFEYTASEAKDKPQAIERNHLEKGTVFSQSAASMKNLVTLLPYMIASKIPVGDPNWKNFLCLLQITILCLSSIISQRTTESLKYNIAQYITRFMILYPAETFTPKLHYLIHFPDQIRLFGPPRMHWCMRFEAKNGFFKQKRWFNYQNIAKSLADYHQHWMCLQMRGRQGEPSWNYLYLGDEVSEGYMLPAENINNALGIINNVLISPKVTINGHTYTPGVVLVKSWTEEPELVQINRIIVNGQEKLFECAYLIIEAFDSHRNTFVVSPSEQTCMMSPISLVYEWPQTVHVVDQQQMVMLENVDDVWGL